MRSRAFRSLTIFALFSSCVVAIGMASNPARAWQRELRKLVQRPADYQVIPYPTSNFGVGTVYRPSGRRVTDADLRCQWNDCFQVDTDNLSREQWLSAGGFAAYGDAGGSVQLTTKEQRDVALTYALPRLWTVLGVDGELKKKSVRSVAVELGRAYPRQLQGIKVEDYFNSLPDGALKRDFLEGRLALVYADLVVSDMKVKVQFDATTAARLDAALSAPRNTPAGGAADPGLDLTVNSEGGSTYSFLLRDPVVALRLVRRQPQAGTLAAGDGAGEILRVPLPR
jgi:hypothetical protein